jgi:hypothetical protein
MMVLIIKDLETGDLIRILEWDKNLTPPMIGDVITIHNINDSSLSYHFLIKQRRFNFNTIYLDKTNIYYCVTKIEN